MYTVYDYEMEGVHESLSADLFTLTDCEEFVRKHPQFYPPGICRTSYLRRKLRETRMNFVFRSQGHIEAILNVARGLQATPGRSLVHRRSSSSWSVGR